VLIELFLSCRPRGEPKLPKERLAGEAGSCPTAAPHDHVAAAGGAGDRNSTGIVEPAGQLPPQRTLALVSPSAWWCARKRRGRPTSSGVTRKHAGIASVDSCWAAAARRPARPQPSAGGLPSYSSNRWRPPIHVPGPSRAQTERFTADRAAPARNASSSVTLIDTPTPALCCGSNPSGRKLLTRHLRGFRPVAAHGGRPIES